MSKATKAAVMTLEPSARLHTASMKNVIVRDRNAGDIFSRVPYVPISGYHASSSDAWAQALTHLQCRMGAW